MTPNAIFSFFFFCKLVFKNNETWIGLLEDVMLFVTKGYLPMKSVDSI
jgi:hypothetical protein